MNPLILDVAFLLLTVFLAFQGWKYGLVRMAGSLVGLVISVTIATWGVAWIEQLTGWNIAANPIVFIVVFLLLTLVLSRLVGFLISLLDLVRKILSIIPFVGFLNSALGLIVGILESVMIIGVLAYVTVTFFPEGLARATILGSQTIGVIVRALVNANVL